MGARRTALAPRRTARAGGGSPGDGAPRDRKERPLRAGRCGDPPDRARLHRRNARAAAKRIRPAAFSRSAPRHGRLSQLEVLGALARPLSPRARLRRAASRAFAHPGRNAGRARRGVAQARRHPRCPARAAGWKRRHLRHYGARHLGERHPRPLRPGAQPALPAALGCPRLHRGARTVRPTGRRPLMMELRKLQKAALAALEDIKAREIEVFDVTHLTSMFDRVIIASADSARQLKALASHVQEKAKAAGGRVYGVEGAGRGDSGLVRLGAICLPILHTAFATHYNLEEPRGQPKPPNPPAPPKPPPAPPNSNCSW